MRRVFEWFINNAKYLLVAYLVVVALTLLLLFFLVDLPFGQSVLITAEVAMGEPPTDFEDQLMREGSVPGWYMAWLLILQFLAWLIIPVLVGVLINEGQKAMERREQQMKQRDGRLLLAGEQLRQDVERSLVRAGTDPDAAVSEAESLLAEWDEIVGRNRPDR